MQLKWLQLVLLWAAVAQASSSRPALRCTHATCGPVGLRPLSLRGGVVQAKGPPVKVQKGPTVSEQGDKYRTVIVDFIKSVTPVVRVWLIFAVALSTVLTAGVCDAKAVCLTDDFVSTYEWWRPFTSMLFFGPLGGTVLLRSYFLGQHGQELERQLGSADFIMFMLVSFAALLVMSVGLKFQFLSDPMLMAVLYYCTRKNPDNIINFFGIKMKYIFFPLVQMIYNWFIQNQSPLPDMAGILVGHLCHFLADLQPKESTAKSLKKKKKWSFNPMKAPKWLQTMFEETEDAPAAAGDAQAKSSGGRKLGGGGKPKRKKMKVHQLDLNAPVGG